MALTEEKVTDKIEILSDGQIQVREAHVIYRDGVEVSRSFNRYVLDPGRHADAEIADERVRAVRDSVWTDKVKNDRAAKLRR
jgi:hypothetical protein